MKEMGSVELIDIHDVTKIFNLSIEAIRKYKALGLIEPCERVGRKDLYNENDIIRTRDLINSYKQEGRSLREIGKKVKEIKDQENLEEELDTNTAAKKLLIIEDQGLVLDFLREQLRACFSESELKIYDARDGLTGIDRAKRIEPDLIILDVLIPKISGEEVHRMLVRQPTTRHSKFII